MKKIRYGQVCVRSVLNKITVVMKIWLFLLIPVGVALASNASSQDLSIELKDVTLREAFRVIEDNSDYSFFFNDSFADLNKKVSLSAKNQSLQNILVKLLAPTNLTYKILDGNLIVIAPKNAQDPITVRGRIVSSTDKQPLPGASVTIKGSPRGTSTPCAPPKKGWPPRTKGRSSSSPGPTGAISSSDSRPARASHFAS